MLKIKKTNKNMLDLLTFNWQSITKNNFFYKNKINSKIKKKEKD